MRIKVHCQNRIGILRDILDLLVAYGVNVARGEVGGEHGDAIYLHCPNLINLQFQALRPKFEAITGVFGVKRVGLMPSERRHMELNALLGALEFPVLSIDMAGAIVAANRAAAQLLGVRVDEVPGMPLSRYAEDFDLSELVRASQSRINGLRVKVRGDVFLADIAPLQSEHDDSEAMAGAVLTLHRADRVGERIYHVRKQELRGFDSIFQSSKVMGGPRGAAHGTTRCAAADRGRNRHRQGIAGPCLPPCQPAWPVTADGAQLCRAVGVHGRD
ncbi:Phenylalanine hydroxylase transcriptional activator PhhR [Pseudomonas savastanoi pv. nerii]|uniref:Phenylalanine hydroxylase transcriptional activator PhhR n=1 Tax=Pseudomonas savastanoi pv. nerii TaxID=360921 RepID=A0AB74BJZ6_PSESS|nr:Phenylalanine hydroxylase transcriptional activator PhhR [Pseudomonas savastanoi]KPY69347.1 Phenylalanine hydroxylase transcriptional activator PhhR [Pseudomonas savastanoi pv. savastanoi]RML98417.1 Phenylalanine hydroxylase transcriptional activator PhhR [Pseudomonas savastanoi]RMT77423.1 Phenylalanine hydroxylase transcriptional activator PhhR [Pseudomonas savastanoi pv. nerii]